MAEGYDCMGNSDCSCAWLDEWLCEYVDGTMDPAVRRAFEEYLSTDPVLAQQVEHLRCTRTLLCRHGCQMPRTRGLRARVQRRLARELVRSQVPSGSAATHLGSFVVVGSVMAAVVMISLLVGAVFLAEEAVSTAEQASTRPDVISQEKTPLGWHPAAMTPLQGHRPHSVPALTRQAVPLTLIRPSSRLPEVFPSALPQTAGLQSVGHTP